MRFMMILKSDPNTEEGVPPPPGMFEAMGRYNQELIKAGVMLSCDGLKPSSAGARIKTSGDKKSVIDGPFAEAKELVGGFWLIQVKSKAEAIEWAKRVPNPYHSGEFEIELRQVFDGAEVAEMEKANREGKK
jgi:hypothetical protein